MSDQAKCELCGEPMPPGEDVFKFHGYSGPCPKPPLPDRAAEPFSDVEFRREYPGANVADHECFLSFTNDGDCCKFHEWWFVAGSQAFADWLRENPSK